MQQQTDVTIRGTCGCGKRYRIRNATAGISVACPNCTRVISISRADIEAANQNVLPLAAASSMMADAKEAILLDQSALRLAASGTRPGITDTVRYTNEEALLNRALSGRSINIPTGGGAFSPTGQPFETVLLRPFALDMLASFWFAGSWRNAANMLVAAVCYLMLQLVAIGPLFAVGLLAQALIFGYLCQFLWVVMKETAAGEDDIPWFDWEFDLYESVVLPTFWIALITWLLTAVPASLVYWLTSPYPGREWLFLGAVAAGWFFFPVSVMCVAIGHSIKAMRPDHLIRAVIAIGPWYLFAWPIVMLVLAGWIILPTLARMMSFVPWFGGGGPSIGSIILIRAVGTAITFYLGYVLFRMIGLLFRHFRRRLPWGF
ncbi:MAG: hypothetical protein JNG88_05030 [Phycisphaerales bacterium]|nr:hypothetical protein [Phycisphaerales bacterium]